MFGGECCLRNGGNYHVHLGFHKFSREAVEAIVLFSSEAVLKHNRLTFDVSEIAETLPEGSEKGRLFLFITSVPKNTNSRSPAPLCASLPRPRDCRAAQKRDELP